MTDTWAPDWLSEHAPREARVGLPCTCGIGRIPEGLHMRECWWYGVSEIMPSAFCPMAELVGQDGTVIRPNIPHNAHAYGEGLQAHCAGFPGTVPATSVSVQEARHVKALNRVADARSRLRYAQEDLVLAEREEFMRSLLLCQAQAYESQEQA